MRVRVKPRTVIVYVVLVGAVVTTGAFAYAAAFPKSDTPESNSRTVAAQMGTVSSTVTATGNLQPATSLNVAFATSGTITEIDVKAGDHVDAGQVLAKVDPTDAQTAVTVAQLNASSATEKYNDAQSNATSTTTTRPPSQATAAAAAAQGASAPSAASTQASLFSAQAAVVQAEQALTDAQTALDDTTLKAPSAGTVSVVNNAVGDKVSGSSTASSASSSSGSSTAAGGGAGTGSAGASGAGTGAAGGGTGAGATSGSGGTGTSSGSSGSSASSAGVLTIVDPTSYQVKVAFPETDAVKVKPDQTAAISVDALTGTNLTGKVVSVDQNATVTSNVVTYGAVVAVDNPPDTIKSGMSVSVTVTTDTKSNVVVVPTAAVDTQGNQTSVTKLVNGQPVRTPVTVGLQGDSTTEITSGLSAGDQVTIATGSISATTGAAGAATGAGAGGRTGAGLGGAGGGFGGGGFGGGGFGGGGGGGGAGGGAGGARTGGGAGGGRG